MAMISGDEPHEDEFSRDTAADAPRTWQHPSEVGMATRGTVDRRRSSKIASVVLVGGVALLITTVLVGKATEPKLVATAAPHSPIPSAIVAVSVSHDDQVHVGAGVVIDDDGHVMVDPASLGPTALDATTSIWVERHDGKERRADLLGTDLSTGLIVLRADDPAGVPVVAAQRPPSDERLSVVGAQATVTAETGSAQVTPIATVGLLGSLASAPSSFSVTVTEGNAKPGAWLFDERGDLVGMTTRADEVANGELAAGSTVEALNGEALLASARRFAADSP